MPLIDDLETAYNDFITHPDAIDITTPKTLAVASVIATLLGVFIGLGYWMVFNSLDCVAVTGACFPNPYAEHKLVIIAITVIIGIAGGVSIPFLKWLHNNAFRPSKNDDDADGAK